jgi:hypothetical protein
MAITKAGVPGQCPALPNPVDATKFLNGTGAFSSVVGGADVQVITATGNWVKPAAGGALMTVYMMGGGGGGGSGRVSAAAAAAYGGGGGGSGG